MIGRPGRLVLLGRSLSHSLSPRIQNAALAREGIALRYETLDIPRSALERILEELAGENAAGNVTIPYKESIAARCLRLTPVAERVGAVNTFWHARGELMGDNTDVDGFARALAELLGREPDGMTLGVLGAGGAAAAVLAATERWKNCRVVLHNRTSERARLLCARFATVAQQVDVAHLCQEADVVINATSIGLRDDMVPVDPAALRPTAVAFDLVYRPGETAWVRSARARGMLAADGLRMLLEQGALAFERWFGFPPDREVMWQAVQGPAARGS